MTRKELEKENAELKAEIENDRDLPVIAYMQGAEKQKKKDKKQLAKAKELLERFLGLGNLWNIDCKDYFPLRKEVEQFLKEKEK